MILIASGNCAQKVLGIADNLFALAPVGAESKKIIFGFFSKLIKGIRFDCDKLFFLGVMNVVTSFLGEGFEYFFFGRGEINKTCFALGKWLDREAEPLSFPAYAAF